MDWVFNGLGTQIILMVITLIIGTAGGGIIGYKVGINKKSSHQKQKAKDGAKQEQKVILNSKSDDSQNNALEINESGLNQKQQAGNNVVQTQMGEIHHE